MPNRRNPKSKRRKSTGTRKRANKARRVKAARPSRPKRVAKKKKHAKKKTATARSRRISTRDANQFDRSARRSNQLSGQQSGDLQGLSRVEDVDSESVEELVEEGNPFEAGAVAGVEEADRADEKEVHTREVPEDDVPGEYLDED